MGIIPEPDDALFVALSELRYDPNARLSLCMMPLATLKWSDEIPQAQILLIQCRETARFMWTIFGIRKELWIKRRIEPAHLDLWMAAQTLLPEWPLFRRLELSPKEYESLQGAEDEQNEIFDFLNRNSDDFTKGRNAFDILHYKATLRRDKRGGPDRPSSPPADTNME